MGRIQLRDTRCPSQDGGTQAFIAQQRPQEAHLAYASSSKPRPVRRRHIIGSSPDSALLSRLLSHNRWRAIAVVVALAGNAGGGRRAIA